MSGDSAMCYWIEEKSGNLGTATLSASSLRRGMDYRSEIIIKHAHSALNGDVLVIPLAHMGEAWAVEAREAMKAKAEALRASLAG